MDAQEEFIEIQIEALHTDVFTFLGVEYHWTARKRSLSSKTREKLRTLKNILRTSTTLTTRQVAVIIGLVRYAAAIVERKLFSFHGVLSWARRLSAMVQTRPEAWDDYIFLPYRSELERMMDELLTLPPVPVYIPP
eukprot:Tbor_TRINITY_DN5916_c0_g1::TRINITY_DN5916_c0_g1_i10::g.19520::m.19520